MCFPIFRVAVSLVWPRPFVQADLVVVKQSPFFKLHVFHGKLIFDQRSVVRRLRIGQPTLCIEQRIKWQISYVDRNLYRINLI